jgi:hypothetical protein
MRCLSPSDVNKILELGEDEATYKKAYENMKAIAMEEKLANQKQKEAYAESEREKEFLNQKYNNCADDKKLVEKELSAGNKRKALQKVGLWCLGIVSAIEGAFIGFDRLILH